MIVGGGSGERWVPTVLLSLAVCALFFGVLWLLVTFFAVGHRAAACFLAACAPCPPSAAHLRVRMLFLDTPGSL